MSTTEKHFCGCELKCPLHVSAEELLQAARFAHSVFLHNVPLGEPEMLAIETLEAAIKAARGDIAVAPEALVLNSARDLLEACKRYHAALDTALAMLMNMKQDFFPSKSPMWPAMEIGIAVIKKAEGALR